MAKTKKFEFSFPAKLKLLRVRVCGEAENKIKNQDYCDSQMLSLT